MFSHWDGHHLGISPIFGYGQTFLSPDVTSCNWWLKWLLLWNIHLLLLFKHPSCDMSWLMLCFGLRVEVTATRAHGMTPRRYWRYSSVKPWGLGQNHHLLPCQSTSSEARNDFCIIQEFTMILDKNYARLMSCFAACGPACPIKVDGGMARGYLFCFLGAMIFWERYGKHMDILVDEVL